jgi:hypothetical protein
VQIGAEGICGPNFPIVTFGVICGRPSIIPNIREIRDIGGRLVLGLKDFSELRPLISG